ncbi:MAG: hypothetical protein OXH97_03220 [Chloroflexota bacterium]|nr:hypothetical protein [Chloroflexota bacterium]MDE2695511.1 hypothetical protein [Chloroflexota bacterium]
MSVPDFALPFDFSLHHIDWVVALTVLFGALLGALAADVLLTLRPFARHRTSRPTAALMLTALVAGCIVFGAFADRGRTPLAAAAGVAALGALTYGWGVHKAGASRDPGAASVLSDDELRRDKVGSDRWMLIAGPAASGKTALVEGMISEARPRMTAPSRSAGDGDLRVTELGLSDRRGAALKLRFWEARSIEGHRRRLPPLSDFDAIVLVVDPTQHEPIAGSFPDTLRAGSQPTDANDDVLRLSEVLEGGCTVWAVVTKADLLRLSVHPPLVDSLPVGPGWYGRVRGMSVIERGPLVGALGLAQLLVEHQPAFAWGRSSPLLAFAGDARGDPFGAPELLAALLETL